MSDNYVNWRARLAGEEVRTFLQPQLFDCGYYRKPIMRKLPNGQNETVDWEPVAIFIDGDGLSGLIGRGDAMQELTDEDLYGERLWSWISNRPITYEVYQAVADRGEPWPDSKEVQLANTMPEIPAANREVTRNDNMPPEEDKRPAYEIAAEQIDAARGVADTFVVTDLKTAEQGLGIVNRLTELRLKAKRDGEAEYKPLYNQYKTLLDAWKPPQDRAQKSENDLTGKINKWKRDEEKRLREEAAKAEAERKRLADEAAAKAAAEEEAAQRAADRAIANGEPPSAAEPPVIQDGPITLAEALRQPIAPTKVELAPTYGRRALRASKPETVVVITDYDAVYNHFKNTDTVKNCLMDLAKGAAKVNVTVPGVTVTKPEE